MLTNQSMDGQGRMLGRYRLLQLIGHGAMGEVWKAEDSQLRRQVAVKLLPKVLAQDAHYLEAFAYEARTAATLEHPHILPIHDFGTVQTASDEVTTYLIMPLINGGALSQRIHSAHGLLPVNECLHYLKQAAQAIDYAHSRQVLHRDIKPANMLLQQQWLFITDFGIAKLLASATYRSQTHAGAGTPEYMAPEQAQGHAIAASDRYSLAMLAYQLFTGTLPFRGDTPYATMMMQLTNPLPPARQFNATIPQVVADTLARGLSKRPEERPPTCLDFIHALELGWRTDQQPALDPDATMLAPWSKRSYENVPQLPFPASNFHQSATQPVHGQIIPSTPLPPFPTSISSTYMQSVPTMPSSYPQNSPGYWQNQATLQSSSNSQNSTLVQSQPESSTAADPKPSKIGRRALVLGGAAATAVVAAGGAFLLPTFLSKSGSVPKPTARIIPGPQKLISGIPLLALTGHSSDVTNVIWNPNGRYLASAGQDTRVMLWDIESYLKQKNTGFQTISTPARAWKFTNEIPESHISWSHNGQAIAVTDLITTKVHFLDTFGKSNAPQEYIDTGLADSVSAPQYDYLACSPIDSTFVTSVTFDNKLMLWQQNQTTTPIKTLSYNQPDKSVPAGIDYVHWSSDGSFIAGIPANFGVVIWQVKTGKVVQEISLPSRTKQHATLLERSDLKYSPNDPYKLATTDIDIVTVYNTQNKNLLLSLGTDDKDALTLPPNDTVGWVPQVGGISWSPNGRYLAGSYGRSNKIYIWDMQDKNPNKTKDGIQLQSLLFGKNNGHSSTILDLAWSPDGRYIATASFDKTIIIWKVDGS